MIATEKSLIEDAQLAGKNRGERDEFLAPILLIRHGIKNLVCSSWEALDVQAVKYPWGVTLAKQQGGQFSVVCEREGFLGSYSMNALLHLEKVILDAIADKDVSRSANKIGQAVAHLKEIGISKTKASSKEKVDLWIDCLGLSGWRKLSIKSLNGNDPSILNGGPFTAIYYDVEGLKLGLAGLRGHPAGPLIRGLSDNGHIFKYRNYGRFTFYQNLFLIDPNLPVLFAEIVLRYFLGQGVCLSNLVDVVLNAGQFPLGREEIELLLKKFVYACVNGFTPATPCEPTSDKCNDLLFLDASACYFVSSERRDFLQKLLFEACYLDVPSSRGDRLGVEYSKTVPMVSPRISLRLNTKVIKDHLKNRYLF